MSVSTLQKLLRCFLPLGEIDQRIFKPMTKTIVPGQRVARLSEQPATQLNAGPPCERPGTEPSPEAGTASETNSGLSGPRIHRTTAVQASLLAQLAQPSQTTSMRGGRKTNEVSFSSAARHKPASKAPIDLNRPASATSEAHLIVGQEPLLTRVCSLKKLNAEYFATNYITDALQNLAPGSNVLVLSDGKESKSAGTFSLDYSNLNFYSTDYDFPETAERIEIFGIGYYRVKIDNTKPINTNAFGVPQTKFGAVLLLKGLCDHNEWQDKQGDDAGPVGCAGVQLSSAGISSLLANITLLLEQNARFALHGDINSMDKVAEHQALGLEVQKNIISGVEKFNFAYGYSMASVHTGNTGLVITGECLKPLSPEQKKRLESMVDEYFSEDRTVTCNQYSRQEK